MPGVTKLPHFRPGILFDNDGNPIASTIPDGLRRLAVDAFISGGGAVGTVLKHTASLSLAALPVSTTTAFGVTKRPSFVAIKFSPGTVGAKRIVIEFDSATGAAFDVEIENVVLGGGTTSYYFPFPGDTVFAAGDEVRVTISGTNQAAATASVTIQAQD